MSDKKIEKGIISTVIESIVGGFERMIEAIKKNGKVTASFTLLIFILLYSIIINPIRINKILEDRFSNHYTYEQKQKQMLIDRRYEANEIVGDIMSKLLYKFNANRVLLLEKHNSICSLGNVDFLFLSCTLEMIDFNNQGIDYMSDNLQRQMTVNLLGNEMIGMLKHSKYVYFKDLQSYNKYDCKLLYKLKEAGEKEVILFPFCDKSHRPLLIMAVCGENLNCEEIVDYIDEFSKQITDLLIFD